jgi:hypothetical protein
MLVEMIVLPVVSCLSTKPLFRNKSSSKVAQFITTGNIMAQESRASLCQGAAGEHPRPRLRSGNLCDPPGADPHARW